MSYRWSRVPATRTSASTLERGVVLGAIFWGSTYPMGRTSRAATANRWSLELFSCCLGERLDESERERRSLRLSFGVAQGGALGVIRGAGTPLDQSLRGAERPLRLSWVAEGDPLDRSL